MWCLLGTLSPSTILFFHQHLLWIFSTRFYVKRWILFVQIAFILLHLARPLRNKSKMVQITVCLEKSIESKQRYSKITHPTNKSSLISMKPNFISFCNQYNLKRTFWWMFNWCARRWSNGIKYSLLCVEAFSNWMRWQTVSVVTISTKWSGSTQQGSNLLTSSH